MFVHLSYGFISKAWIYQQLTCFGGVTAMYGSDAPIVKVRMGIRSRLIYHTDSSNAREWRTVLQLYMREGVLFLI